MIYYTNGDSTVVYAIENESELSFLPSGLRQIDDDERDRILETLKPPVTGDMIRAERDARIESTQWIVQRHRDEIEAVRKPTLSDAQYVELQTYRQALRDVPDQSDFPANVEWPAKPGWMR